MLHIAVCDDETKYIRDIGDSLRKYGNINSIDLKIDTYHSGMEFLNADKRYDIIYLDVEMEGINGIEVAEKIRETDMKVPIVYVTSYEYYWRRAYKVHAFQFIVKPVKEEEIFKIMDDYIAASRELKEKKVQLKCEEGIIFAAQSDIFYFYIEKKKTVHVKMTIGEYTVKENLRDIFEKLDREQFYVSHKSCIINLCYVRSLENGYDIIMDDGEFMPLAQNRRGEFLGRLTNRCMKTLKGGIM